MLAKMLDEMRQSLPKDTVTTEAAIIASVYADREIFDDVSSMITAGDFKDLRYGAVWSIFEQMAANSEPIDLITVKNHVIANKLEPKVGGLHFLVDMTSPYVTLENAEHYARIVADDSKVRSLSRQLENIRSEIISENYSSDTIIGNVEQMLLSVEGGNQDCEPIPLGDLYRKKLDDVIKCIENGNTGRTGITTGFIDLDSMLAGFHGGELIVLAGRPSMGKSTMMLNMARHIAKEGDPVLIFSLEMSSGNITGNMSVAEFRIDAQKFRKMELNQDDLATLIAGSEDFSKLPIYIEDTAGLPLRKMVSASKRWHRRHGIKAIFVDYLQLLTATDDRNRSREQEVAAISRGLKKLAKDLDIPVVALSQLSRNNTQRKDPRPMLSDLRESGAIEQDADVVLFVHRDEYYDGSRPGLADIIIAKQRNGPVGNVETSFIETQLRFENTSLAKYTGMNV